jgi:hypothetical protein
LPTGRKLHTNEVFEGGDWKMGSIATVGKAQVHRILLRLKIGSLRDVLGGK